jgi:hypothetical protein
MPLHVYAGVKRISPEILIRCGRFVSLPYPYHDIYIYDIAKSEWLNLGLDFKERKMIKKINLELQF